jgi:transcriptional regulator with XRE-family HTH domain
LGAAPHLLFRERAQPLIIQISKHSGGGRTMSPSVEKMILVLKEELKAKGLKRRDVAARLGVSEITVKRYLSGRSVTIATLEALAALVNLDLLSLAAQAQAQSESTPTLSKAQQAALGSSQALVGVYMLLVRGWSPGKIEKEFAVTSQKLESILTRLQNLGVIRRVSPQSIRILALPDPDQTGGTQLSDLWRDRAREFLSKIDLRDERCEWFYNVVRLSPASVGKVRGMIDQLMLDVRALGRNDVALSQDEVKWYEVFIGAQPKKKIDLELAGL